MPHTPASEPPRAASPTDLVWLPLNPHWRAELNALRTNPQPGLTDLLHLATARLDTLQTLQLDRALTRFLHASSGPTPPPTVRVALLGSSTLRHLLPSLRIAGLRRGLLLELYETAYGQYMQELLDPASPLAAFRPDLVLLALDARHLGRLTATETVAGTLRHLAECWRLAREHLGATVIQQTCLPVFPDLLGSNEHRLPTSPAAEIAALNAALRPAADEAGVTLLALDAFVRWGGIDAWSSPNLWNHAKQEIHPAAAPLWGDLAARVIAALRGRSAKCLVLDLDNTLWGGVVGDDGPAALAIGQGSAAGEAHLALQQLALDLRRRGILLAICSKNDDAVVRAAFAERPEMPLALTDFASIRANWSDKASNLRSIASELRLSLDALVFLDDNPAERALIRQELPEVHVPELPPDPALFAETLSRAGYFESIALTGADLARAGQYTAEAARTQARAATTDMAGYLASLAMRMRVRPFDEANLPRIVQLANKTNQFNLTTHRLSEPEVRRWLADPGRRTWQVELSDRFGDYGTVALLAGTLAAAHELTPRQFTLDLWLMSCRVLGREVEDTCLNIVAAALQQERIARLTALYRPSGRNQLVAGLYDRLGFTRSTDDGSTNSSAAVARPDSPAERWHLDLTHVTRRASAITIDLA